MLLIQFWKKYLQSSVVSIGIALTLFVSSISSASALTPTIHSVSTFGNWSDSGSWIEGRVPTTDDVVEIDGDIYLYGGASLQGLHVANGGHFTGAYGTITINGDIDNDGVINNSSTLITHGDLTNNGSYTVGFTYTRGTGAILAINTPIETNLYIDNDSFFPNGLVLTGGFAFENPNGFIPTITLPDNHSLEIHGDIHNSASIVGSGISLNAYGGIYNFQLSTPISHFNVRAQGQRYYHGLLSIKADYVTIFSGTSLLADNWGTSLSIDTKNLSIQNNAGLNMGYHTPLFLTGNLLNEGRIDGDGYLMTRGDIENKGAWNIPTSISWNSYPGATNYNITFFPGTSSGITISGLSYNISDRLTGQYYWQVTPNNASVPYALRCINMGCVTGGSAPVINPYTALPTLPNTLQYLLYPQEYTSSIVSSVSNNTSTTTQPTDALDPVDLATGDFTYNNTLLHLGGDSLDYDFSLQYRSRSIYDGPVGYNWDHNYNQKLVENTGGNVTYYDGKLGKYTFVASGSGFAHMGGLNVDLMKSASGTYTMFFNDGTRYTFGENKKISTLTNKYGKSLNFAYNSSGALTTVTDTLGRTISYSYDTTDHLTSVAESGGKSVELAYYGSGETDGGLHDLKSLAIKNSTETKTISFTYFTGTGDSNLDHNIKKLIDSKGQVYVENAYDTNDRVLSQKYGNDTGSYVYTLADIHEDDTPTTVGTGKVIGTYVMKNRATNRDGKVTEYAYDRMGNVTERTSSMDDGTTLTTRYTYNGFGQLIEEILPNGNGTAYDYDALGNKSMIRKKADMAAADNDATDIITTLTYNGAKNTLSSVVDPRGKTTEFITDANGNIIDIVEKDTNGARLRGSHFVYDALGHLTESTDARGSVTKMVYMDGRLTSLTRGYGTQDATTTSYTYDTYGNPLTVTDGRGNTKTFTYDAYDRLTHSVTAEGIIGDFTFDANNNKTRTSTTLEGGAQVTADTVYNLLDKPTTLTADIDANQRATLTYTYDANENLLTTTYPNGQVEQRIYDALNRLVKKETTGSTTHTTLYTYDANGNIITENRDGQTSTFTYDGYDRLVTSVDAGGTSTSIIYDQGSNIIETNQKDNAGTVLTKTTYTYDVLGRVMKTSLSGDTPRVTLYTYDAGNNLLTETDANGHTTTSTYDTLGRQETVTLPSGLMTTSVYDANGNIIESRVQHDGTTLTTTAIYDRDNRKTSTTDANGNTTHYEYNSLGQVVTVTDPSSTPTTYTYDYRGNIKTETRAGKTITKSYDTLGNLTSLTDANGNTTTYTYNGNNELTQELLSDGNKTSYTYDTRGNIHTKTDPNGTVTTYTYDSLSRITRKDYTLATGVGGVTSETYTYDALGHLTASNNSDNNQSTFTYDTLGNLTSESTTTSGNPTKTTTYTYDAAGNKVGMHTPNGRTLTYTYDAMNRLTSVKEGTTNIANYTYNQLDLTQEVLANGVTTNYGYDNGNRLNNIQSPAQSDSLTYDPNSNITSKGIETYIYDPYNQLTEAMYGNTRFGTGIQGNTYEYDLMGNRQNEQNIRIITRTNKKTGTTIEIQRNKIWNYTVNGLNQYTDILAQSGTVLVSTGIVNTNTGIVTNTGILTDSGTTSTGSFEFPLDKGGQGDLVSETGSTNTEILTDTGTTATGVVIVTDSGATNTGTTSTGDILTSTGATADTGVTSTGETVNTGTTDSGTTLIYSETGTTESGTILIASDVILVDTGATNTGTTTDSGVSISLTGETQEGLASDSGTLTDTGVIEVVDTGALQGRLLYDKNGNLIGNTINNKRQFEYVYDAQNRMIQVNRYNDVTGKEVLISFSYDALGRRTSKKVVNQLTEYVYSGNDVIEETMNTVNPTNGNKVKQETREYTYGARGTDDVVAVKYSTYDRIKKVDILVTTGNYYYEKDHIGSVIRITDSNGNIIDEYSYTVFGKPYKKNTNGLYKPVSGSNKSAINNTRLYTGREHDKEISLYYMRARYYDAGLGRFVSRDPIGMRDNVNLYTYVKNNPLMYTDRMGLNSKPFLQDVQDVYLKVFGYPGDVLGILVAEHYTRNINSTVSYYKEDDIIKHGWTLQPEDKSIYHTYGAGNEGNKKYLSPDGHDELVFDSSGRIVIDPVNEGTYNYGTSILGHAIEDVIPYYVLGNSQSDTTTFFQRVERYFETR